MISRPTANRFTYNVTYFTHVCNEIYYFSRVQNIPEASRMSKYPWITLWELLAQEGSSATHVLVGVR